MNNEIGMTLIYDGGYGTIANMYKSVLELGGQCIMLCSDSYGVYRELEIPENVVQIKTFKNAFDIPQGLFFFEDDYGDYSRQEFKTELIEQIETSKDIIFAFSGYAKSNLFFEKNEDLLERLIVKNKRVHLIVGCDGIDALNLTQVYLRTLKNVNRYYSVGFFDTSAMERTSIYGYVNYKKNESFNEQLDEVFENMLVNILLLDNEKNNSNLYVYNADKQNYELYDFKKEDILENYSLEEQKNLAYKYGHHFEETIAPNEGKATCKMLAKLRSEFARKYGKHHKEGKCSYDGPCKGTCIRCERQTEKLNEEVMGKLIHVDDKTNIKGDISGISRVRINLDGKGIRTLVVMNGCELECRYCLNKGRMDCLPLRYHISPKDLAELVNKDNVYYDTTDGGITFGGGEPLLQSDFILQFHSLYPQFDIAIETALNVPTEEVMKLINVVSEWIVDIKDMHPEIYANYTGRYNNQVIKNLNYLVSKNLASKVKVRVPLIPRFNSEEQRDENIRLLSDIGLYNFDLFTYQV